ncbi:MAG TPA: UDP-glucose 4-epimerase GalE [Alcanivorax sp.]|jgi:UDP-glucose 4-epimerase|nr:UDP-glucose 4-epimerase GalE [Pseudomonadota bacterium]HAB09232.1 UDP-glucose 4-epimerase GalE [Alcanivorax sp.]HAI24100.1 UDP-glucose 4-epimerase GalE [Alcanivorax sp.]HBP76146.1 UDP-glucose 4-epimerase GalE [Alcanivorax sp.]|tara:strand:- start:3110 stop:4126 length:1017 start_codon:yes stop_codon:yes gene_type:complete
MDTVLVTGGAGYIGSHTVLLLLEAGRRVLVLDNLSNSSREALERVAAITGKRAEFVEGDIRDTALLDRLFQEHEIGSVIHFAGLKAVGESVAQPLRYYDCNVTGSLRLLEAMDRAGVRNLVFSSSATVYGDPASVPIREDFPLSATNPYGATKLHIEDMLRDLHRADPRWSVALLRYFNPVGAHESGRIGEDPNGEPNNLMPYVAQVAVGKREQLRVFGDDYDTPDGTGVRDYIHVMDLAEGHLAALDALARDGGLITTNLGTGRGYSVLEMVRAFAAASGREVRYQIAERRPGDVASCYADPAHAKQVLGWEAKRGIDTMCADHWRWQSDNPNGYRG